MQSLASVAPPEITYRHHLQDIVRSGKLSNLQLESVLYAMQKFEGPLLPSQERQGFFLGDGAGVGKGRQIAALIKEHWKCGRRSGGRRLTPSPFGGFFCIAHHNHGLASNVQARVMGLCIIRPSPRRTA